MSLSEPREVYSALDLHDAHRIRALLEDAGIEAHVVGEHLQNAVGDLPAVAIEPKVWVRNNDYDVARKVIDKHLKMQEQSSLGRSDWVCPQCNEANEGTFEICWNCLRPRAQCR